MTKLQAQAYSLSLSALTPVAHKLRVIDWQRVANVYARFALGAAFLSGIASRFGLYGKDQGYGNFANFVKYTAEVNSFMPAYTIPFLAWAATAAELGLGILLVLGLWPRWTAWGSALLLAMFGIAMAISFGIRSPLDYSVFSASAHPSCSPYARRSAPAKSPSTGLQKSFYRKGECL